MLEESSRRKKARDNSSLTIRSSNHRKQVVTEEKNTREVQGNIACGQPVSQERRREESENVSSDKRSNS